MNILESFLVFVRKLEETHASHFENLAITLLRDSIISVDEFIWSIFDQSHYDGCRLYALEYIEIMVRLASKSEGLRKPFCSNKIMIRWLEHIRGWSTVDLIGASLTIIWLIPSLNHYFCYKKRINKRFAKLKKDLLDYLDNFASDSEEGKKIISLIEEIKNIE